MALLLILVLVLHPPLAAPQGALQQDSATTSPAVGPVSFSFPAFSLGRLGEEGQDAFVPRLSRLRRVGTVVTQIQWELTTNLNAVVFPQYVGLSTVAICDISDC